MITSATRNWVSIQPPAVPEPLGPMVSRALQVEPPLLEIWILKTSALGLAPWSLENQRQYELRVRQVDMSITSVTRVVRPPSTSFSPTLPPFEP